MEGVRAAKRRLRREIESRRRAVTGEQRARASREIVRHVLLMPEYVSASRIVAYVATAEEASLAELLDVVRASGRTLLLPRIEGDALAFVPADDLEALRVGSYGLREPTGSPVDALAETDLALVPGVAFDRRGGRLGRGGGFYDRSLPRGHATPYLIGVALHLQLVACVPREPHDRGVDAIVTEAGVVRVAPRDPTGDPG